MKPQCYYWWVQKQANILIAFMRSNDKYVVLCKWGNDHNCSQFWINCSWWKGSCRFWGQSYCGAWNRAKTGEEQNCKSLRATALLYMWVSHPSNPKGLTVASSLKSVDYGHLELKNVAHLSAPLLMMSVKRPGFESYKSYPISTQITIITCNHLHSRDGLHVLLFDDAPVIILLVCTSRGFNKHGFIL